MKDTQQLVKGLMMEKRKIFKICPMCSTEWKTRDEFLDDQSLKINGYGVDFEKLDRSLFYFTHRTEGCFSTLALKAEDFLDLYSGTKYAERRTGYEDCPGYCLEEEQLNRCDALCECAFNREITTVNNKFIYQHNLPEDGCSRQKGAACRLSEREDLISL